MDPPLCQRRGGTLAIYSWLCVCVKEGEFWLYPCVVFVQEEWKSGSIHVCLAGLGQIFMNCTTLKTVATVQVSLVLTRPLFLSLMTSLALPISVIVLQMPMQGPVHADRIGK